jgi:hypothetical protein
MEFDHDFNFDPRLPRILRRTARRDLKAFSSVSLPSAPTQDYEAYIIGPDGHITTRIDLHCADEERAKESAQQLVGGQAVELWQQERKIATFAPRFA